jgi:excisionase family DNA binding protein
VEDNLLNIIREAVRVELQAATCEILTTDQAAKFLGIEKSYLYHLTSANLLRFSRPGGKKIYFARQDLIEWALSNRNTTREELEEKASTYNAISKK